MRAEIRRMKLEKTFVRADGTLSQTVVRNVNEAVRDQEGCQDAGNDERRRSDRDQQIEINLTRGKQPDRDSVVQRAVSSRSRLCIFSTVAEAHKRSTSMSPAVSTKTAKTKEAKGFSKSEAELAVVMYTLSDVISIVEKEIAKNSCILEEGNRYT